MKDRDKSFLCATSAGQPNGILDLLPRKMLARRQASDDPRRENGAVMHSVIAAIFIRCEL